MESPQIATKSPCRSLGVSWARVGVTVLAIANIIETRKTIESFELQIFIRHPFIGISHETGISGK